MQVNTGRDQTHHHGPLAGLGAAAAAVLAGVLFAGVLVLVVWRHIAGQVSAAVAVFIWTSVIAFVAVAALGVVLAGAFVRHRVLHPEALTRPPAVRAEVLDPPPPLEIPPAPVAELPAGHLWRLNPRATPEPDQSRKRI